MSNLNTNIGQEIPQIKIKLRKKTHRNYLNLFYKEEAVNLVRKLSKKTELNTTKFIKQVIGRNKISLSIKQEDILKIKALKNIQKTLKSNLTQLADLSKFIEEEFTVFKSFSKEQITISGKQYKTYEALNYFLKISNDLFIKFDNLQDDYLEVEDEEVLEILEQIRKIDYVCDKLRKERVGKANRLYIYLNDDAYSSFKKTAKELADTKQYLLDKNNKSKKPNLTATFWYLLANVDLKERRFPISNDQFLQLKQAADDFNEVVHKANACRLNATDFKPTELYEKAVILYKVIKTIFKQ